MPTSCATCGLTCSYSLEYLVVAGLITATCCWTQEEQVTELSLDCGDEYQQNLELLATTKLPTEQC